MSLGNEDIDEIVRLAKFHCRPAKRKRLLDDLNKVLDSMRIIDDVAIEDVGSAAYSRKSLLSCQKEAIVSAPRGKQISIRGNDQGNRLAAKPANPPPNQDP